MALERLMLCVSVVMMELLLLLLRYVLVDVAIALICRRRLFLVLSV